MTRTPLRIENTARLLGAYSYVEGRLYEVLGTMASDEPLARAALLFEELSQQHAWHASLFAEHVPVLAGADPGSLRASPGTPAELALERLAGAADSAARLAMLARAVLPRLVAGYRRHLERANRSSDAPVIRALRLVVRDEVEAGLECETLLEECLAGVDPARALAEALSVEQLLAPGGPGWVPWPS